MYTLGSSHIYNILMNFLFLWILFESLSYLNTQLTYTHLITHLNIF